jgi:prephenate dehydrogenase
MFKWLAGGMLVTARRVAVLGLGLIGGSLLRRFGAQRAVGYDADAATREAASEAGLAIAGTVAEATEDADVVVLAVPLPALGAVLAELRGFAGLVTDVTSVKARPRALAAGLRWVGGHPMAGREQSGFAAADPALFDGCAWVLCLEPETPLDDWLAVAALVTGLGARVVPATADEHDAAVARISHAPHVVAAALAESAGAGREGALALALGAGSFRDGTRVAATRPALTAAMCAGNADALRAELDVLIGRLAQARDLLDDPDALTDWLGAGHAVRAKWPAEPGPEEKISADQLLELGRAGGWVTAVGAGQIVAVRPR